MMRRILLAPFYRASTAVCLLVAASSSHFSLATALEPTEQGMRDALQTIAGKENPQRLEGIMSILDDFGVDYEVESFTYDAEELKADIPEEERNSPDAYDFINAKGKSRNLVVTLGAGEADIVIGAHYDRVHVGDGVVDNGASSIILTRLAEALKDESLNYRVRIVWFGAEELGLIGSRDYVKQHEDDNIVSMINLDVNAYGDTTLMGPMNQTGHNRLYQLAKQACIKNGYKFLDFPNFGGSDNESFTAAGIEAIGMSMAPWDEAEEFWLGFNGTRDVRSRQLTIMGNMHSPLDTMERAEGSAMIQNYNVVLDMVNNLNQVPYVKPANAHKELPGLRDDVQKLAGKSNTERLEALKGLLDEANIAYEEEHYTYEPRNQFPEEMLEEMSGEEKTRFINADGKGKNLIVTLGEGEREFIVGGHYDKVTVGEGVVDNGASSVILTRIAKALKDEDLAFRVKVIWFGDEEMGHIGSRDYVDKHKDDPIIGMIAMDVNAYGDMIMVGPSADTGINRLYELAEQITTTNDLPFTIFPQYGGSDNEAFTAAGFDAMGLGIAPTDQAYEFWLDLNGGDGERSESDDERSEGDDERSEGDDERSESDDERSESDDERSEEEPQLIRNMHSPEDTMELLEPLAMSKSFAVAIGIIRKLNEEYARRGR